MSSIVPELDDIGYQELREDSEARIPEDAPTWTEQNLSDPGITFLEMLSWLGDIELYRLNRITPKHLQGFLALLGDYYPSTKASSGLIVSSEGIPENVFIEKETVIHINGKKFRSQNNFYGNPAKIEYIDVLVDSEPSITRITKNGEIEPFYAFGEIPKEGNDFRLILDHIPSNNLNLYIEINESNLPPYNQDWKKDEAWLKANDSVELAWYLIINNKALHLQPNNDTTLNLRYSGLISFSIEEEMPINANVIIACKLKRNSYMIAPFIDNMYLNSIEIEQSELIHEKKISNGEANQVLTLDHQSVLDNEGTGVSIEINNAIWNRVDSFIDAKENDKVFTYDNTLQKVLFGDGERGQVVPYTEDILCQYLVSKGEDAVVANSINTWEIKGFEKLNFYNPKSISDAQSLPNYEERFAKIIENFKTPTQAVTLSDYEKLSMMTAGLRIARAKAFVDRNNNTISVVVLPYSRNNYSMPDNFFCKRVCRFLDSRRLITTRVKVIKPIYTDVRITIYMAVDTYSKQERIREESINAIDEYLHPLKGGDDKNGWEFGRGVYLSDIYSIVNTVEGVNSILNIVFDGEGLYDREQKVYSIKRESLIKTLEHHINFEPNDKTCGDLL